MRLKPDESYDVIKDSIAVFTLYKTKHETPTSITEIRAFFLARSFWKGYAAAYGLESLFSEDEIREQALTTWREFLELAHDVELAILQTQRPQSR